MRNKTILLALAAVSAALFALPAVASAGEWEIDTASGKFPTFTAASIGNTTLTQDGSNSKVTCTKSVGTGKYTTKTTGVELTLTFTGCTLGTGNDCTTAGQAAGTIKTTDLTFHNIMIEKTGAVGVANGRPGILITPNGVHFASFVCHFFGLEDPVTVNGTGLIGDISAPACGATSNTATLKFESAATGTQKYMQITTEGTKFDLSSNENGTVRTASQDGEGTVTFSEPVTMTCP
jgi:hypothetical protein